ncbi:MAG: PhzF family phenazine biosynthesis isomerase, partial [Gammaproteobacteria bacterium]
MAAGYRFRILDVFTSRPYAGNPLAVLPEAQGLSAAQMRGIAREFAFSATAFVRPTETGGHTHRLRIFAPAGELPFAGHATVGAALTLAMEGDESPEFVFEETVGTVKVSMRPGEGSGTAWLRAARSPEVGPEPPPPAALAALLSLRVTDLLAGAW